MPIREETHGQPIAFNVPQGGSSNVEIQRSTPLKPPQDDSNNFVRGLKGGVQSLQATGYGALGLAGKAVGSDKLRDVGFEGYQRNIEEGKPFQTDVQNFTDIKDVKSAGQWAAGTAGQLLPFIGESIAAAGIGAALGSAVAPGAGTVAGGLAGRTVLKKGINAYLKSATGKAVAKSHGAAAARAAGTKIAARNLGSAAGVVAGTAIPESGGMFGESAEKHGIENANWMSAAGLGLISGASELLAPGGKFARAAFGKGGKEFLDNYGKTAGKSLWKRLGIQVPKDMAREFGQEAFQEFLSKVNEKVHDPEVSLKDKEALMGYFNSGMAGALGGGLFGTVGAVQQPGPVREGAGPMERLVNGLPPEVSGKLPETDTPPQGVNTDVETSPLDLAPQNKEEQANELAWQAREAEEAGYTEDAAELQAQADALYGEVEQGEQEEQPAQQSEATQKTERLKELTAKAEGTPEYKVGDKTIPAVQPSYLSDAEQQELQMLKSEEAAQEDTLYSYAGIESKTRDAETLFAAEDMEREGKTTEEIRKETGWFKPEKGDGKWRYEINDKDATVSPDISAKLEASESVPLAEIFQHDGLYEAYPNLQLVEVSTDKGMLGASMEKKDNGRFVLKMAPEKVSKETILHEVQHSIQSMEEFARGGSPKAELKKYTKRAKSAEAQIDRFNAMLKTVEGTPEYETVNAAKEDFIKYHASEGTLNRKKALDKAFRDYNNLLGEIEARDVAERADLTPEQRKELPPYVSQGIKPEDQIVKGAGGVAAKATSLSDIKKKWKGNKLHISETKNEIRLNTVIVPKNKRKQGVGSGIMNDLTEYADSKGKTLLVTPAVKDDFHGTTSQARLKKFYKRFGFVENKGRNKDFAINARDMYREPVEQDVIAAKAEKPATVPEKPAKKESVLRKEVGAKTVKALEKKGLLELLTVQQAKAMLKKVIGPKFMTAWHGTPHEVDQFSSDKIGTGEGAQAYGYGLYFAGNKEVADYYRKALSGKVVVDGVTIYDKNKIVGTTGNEDLDDNIIAFSGDMVAALKDAKKNLARVTKDNKYQHAIDYAQKEVADIQDLVDRKAVQVEESGNLYQVDLKPKEEEYLLWDKPLSEQSEFVKKTLKEVFPKDEKQLEKEIDAIQKQTTKLGEDRLPSNQMREEKKWHKLTKEKERLIRQREYVRSGASMYATILPKGTRTLKEAEIQSAKMLSDLGIRGNKYFDGSSRGKQEGNHNYVIFDDADVTIEARYSKDGEIEGFSYGGKAYLIPENIAKGKGKATLLHEIGHTYLPEVFQGKQWDNLTQAFEKHSGKDTPVGRAVDAAKARVPEGTNPAHVSEENIMYYLSETANQKQNLYRQIMAYLKKALLKLGFPASMLHPNDIVVMVDGYINSIATGKETTTKAVPQTVNEFAQPAKMSLQKATDKIIDSAAFKKWFGDSKVVDENGEPLVVYHGTGQEFNSFSISEDYGAFFSSSMENAKGYKGSRKGRTLANYLAIKRPFIVEADGAGWYEIPFEGGKVDMFALVKKIREMDKYDGIIVRGVVDTAIEGIGASDTYVAFSPTQIKSIYNTGTFDETNPDIRFSVPRQYTPEQAQADENVYGKQEKKSLKQRYEEAKVHLGTKTRQAVVDQFASIDSILGDKEAWMMAHLTKGDTGAMMAAINDGIPYLDRSGAIGIREGSKSLKQILEPLGTEIDDFLKWIAAHRAERLAAEDRENLFSDTDIAAHKTLNQGTMADGRDRAEVYQTALKEFEQMGQAITYIGVKSGLINRAEAAKWKQEGWYVPFYRMMEEEKRRGPASIGELTGQQGFKRLKGGTDKLEDLLSNTLLNWQHLLGASLRNQAGKKTLESAESMGIAQRVPKEIKSKDAVYVRENGKEVWYEFDDSVEGQLVLSSLMSLNYEGLNNPAMKVARLFKRALTTGVTASPEFKLANIMRDTIHAMAVSGVSKKFWNNVIVGWNYDTKGMEAGGGAFGDSGYIYGNDPAAMKNLVAKGVSQDAILNTKGKVRKMWQKYQDFGAKLENVNRVASFVEDTKKGKTLLEKNFNARDQLDFARTGSHDLVRFIASTVPFLNARLQGLDKMRRSLYDRDQRKQFLQVTGTYAALSVGLALFMSGDDDYDKAEEWEKRAYHLFKIPGSDLMYRYPRPFEVGAIAYLGEQLTRQFLDENAQIPELKNALLHTISDTFALNPIPQVFKPMLEVYSNKSMFTGRAIESMGIKNLSSTERFHPWTGPVAKGASKAMGAILPDKATLSPVQLQHMVRGYLGWLGATTLAASDGFVRIATGEETPETKWYEYTPVKRFARETEGKNTKYVTTFYDNMESLNKMWADIGKYKGTPKGQALYAKHINKVKYRKAYTTANKQMSDIRKQEKYVYKSDMPAGQKRKQLIALKERKNNIAKRIVRMSQ